jgi:protein-S-isoprenylcysteine O-methyltransferase Ste14
MTRWGVGPKWMLVSLGFAAPAFAARALWPDLFAIPMAPRPVVAAIGAALLAIGVPFFAVSARILHRGFGSALFTGGPYGLCRNPIYASWIVFNVPGLVLLSDSWLGLFTPLPMYAALRVMVRAEEAWLEERFGDAYRAYRARVPAVCPAIGLWRRLRRAP